MSLDRSVLAFAGFAALLPVLPTAFVSPYFVWLTVFVGMNLPRPAFTGLCPAAKAFKSPRVSCIF